MPFIHSSKLNWDLSTGYDFFISQMVLYEPDRFGLRASWAAGIRARIPLEYRQAIETFLQIAFLPMQFIFSMPAPKDTALLLAALESLPPEKRLEALTAQYSLTGNVKEILLGTSTRKPWTAAEKGVVEASYSRLNRNLTPTQLDLVYKTWADREKFGYRHLCALKTYAEAFFYEEEQRILPVLRQSLSHAQMRAGTLPLIAMLEELSAGVRWADVAAMQKIFLAPSFWGAPFLISEKLNNNTALVIFGSRPDNLALIPGDIIPDNLLRGLKALADPTRLRILRTLAHTPYSAAHLAHVLRLRPATVNHHLMELRVAGMVHVIISSEGDRCYATRFEAFESTQDLLNRFLNEE
ncbi:MAG TPA: helix-turn-helix domain-containing protein [Anaerolineaceae bacterium]|jgi:DNA-binding transcriptional ArsR family regulator|nr:helix-turn-helix domain-containing protein [Anaerolineales bacterium]HQK42180.1 helix-turn-helix domain-containing protein [Anaerolineaceae bacterium]